MNINVPGMQQRTGVILAREWFVLLRKSGAPWSLEFDIRLARWSSNVRAKVGRRIFEAGYHTVGKF